MRVTIVENGASRLELRLRTNVLLYAAFGLLFVGLGLWCIRLLAVETRIEVDAQRFQYTKTCLWVFACAQARAAVADVRSVELVDYEIEVALPDGTHRLELTHSDGQEKSLIARSLRDSLAPSGAAFRHEEGSPLAGFLLGSVCVVCGVALLAAIQWVRVIADRAAGTLRLGRKLLLWPGRREREFALGDIDAVDVKPYAVTTDQHSVISYAVRLRTRGGDAVGLTLLPMFTETAATDLARTLREWLAR